MDYLRRVGFEKKEMAYWGAAAALVLFILFLHIYRLDELPKGMEVDEVGMAYDSWCIGNFKVDRYLNSFPVYLNNYGGGQSTMYCYLAVPFLKNAGFSAAMARMPGMLFSMLTCIVGFDLIRKVRGKTASLIYLFLFAALPYFTQSGRIALDCNLMLGCTVVILHILEFCLRQKDKLWPYVILGVVTGISLYSYALSNMIYPVFFLLLYPLLLIGGKKLSWKQILVFFLPAFVLAIPLILVQVVNIAKTPNMMIGPLTIPRIDFYRLTEISIHEVRPNIRWIFRSLFTADNQEFDSFPQFGALYLFSLPMIIAGVFICLRRALMSIREKKISFETIILFYTVLMMAFALVLLGVTTYRINAVFFGLTYLIMVPIEACFTAENKKRVFAAAGIVLIAVYTFSAGAFLHYYFTRYEKDYYPQRLFAENPRQVYEFIESRSEEIKNRLTYVGGVNEAYAYYLLSMKISPYDYDVKTLGNNGDGKRYLFYAPQPYDTNANYVFYLPDEETDKTLTEMGFSAQDLGPYRVYIH